MSCKAYNTFVGWVIDPRFIKTIKHSLENDKFEIAGSILFEDTNCRGDICDKKSVSIHVVNGKGSSVKTPNGIINFHTHPKQCYIDENTSYGWPSGEDMAQSIIFAKKGTLVHIVFTLEGAYLITVKKILTEKQTDILEDILKYTHVYRVKNQEKQYLDFRKTFGLTGESTVDMWLQLVNGLSIKKLYIYHNKFEGGNLKSTDDSKIFSVKLLNFSNGMKFSAKFIKQSCHENNFNKFKS